MKQWLQHYGNAKKSTSPNNPTKQQINSEIQTRRQLQEAPCLQGREEEEEKEEEGEDEAGAMVPGEIQPELTGAPTARWTITQRMIAADQQATNESMRRTT